MPATQHEQTTNADAVGYSYDYVEDYEDFEYIDYDDFQACDACGGGGGVTKKKTKKRQQERGGGGSGSIYSAKHVRAKVTQRQGESENKAFQRVRWMDNGVKFDVNKEMALD
jgi:hypothetical protein